MAAVISMCAREYLYNFYLLDYHLDIELILNDYHVKSL